MIYCIKDAAGGTEMDQLELTGIMKKEGRQYSALCLELDVASCGDTREKAMKALRDAVETYVQYMVEEGREDEIYRPVPLEALREFLTAMPLRDLKGLNDEYNVTTQASYNTSFRASAASRGISVFGGKSDQIPRLPSVAALLSVARNDA
jgi:predicted RNase H-like HicB family nuclease